jgi:hypothetical protein
VALTTLNNLTNSGNEHDGRMLNVVNVVAVVPVGSAVGPSPHGIAGFET